MIAPPRGLRTGTHLLRFAGAMALAVPLLAAACITAIGTALLLLGGSLAGLGGLLVRSDRLQRRQIVEALGRASLRPLPLTGALAALLGVILALALGVTLHIAAIEDSLLPVLRQALTRHAIPLLVGLLVLGEAGLGLTARLTTMTLTGESDTLRSLGIAPAGWVLPTALLEFLTLAAVQFLVAVAIASLAAALLLQAQLGLPAARTAAAWGGEAARADLWRGLARSETAALFAWMVAACAGVAAPGDGLTGAVRRTFIVTLLGLLAIAAAFTWFGA